MADNQLLIQKLDHFIRKYYKNRMIRGGLWFFTIIAAFYLWVVISEFLFHFEPAVRTVLFFTFAGFALFLFARLVAVPFLQLARIGKVISYDQAAEIVGEHFSEIQDKLLNTLQLIRQSQFDEGKSELVSASIEQKTKALKVFMPASIINRTFNLKQIKI